MNWSAFGVNINALCTIEEAYNDHALKYDDVVNSIRANDDAIHCTKVDDAFNACCNIFPKPERILDQTRNNSDDNQCDNNNNTIDLLILYTNMNMMLGLYYVTPSVSLGNVRLSNVHIMTTIGVLLLSLLELFGKCSKRMHVKKLSIMTELDLSIITRKLGVRNIEY